MLTQTRIKELLTYDPSSGELRWKDIGSGKRRARAGWARGEGHRHICIEGQWLMEHRAIWLYMTGELPDREIDHIDLNKTNNRWSNLRLATHGQNSSNRPAQSNNSIGLKGISFWYQRGITYVRARATANGKTNERCFSVAKLGVMEATAAAVSWVRGVRTEIHGEFAKH